MSAITPSASPHAPRGPDLALEGVPVCRLPRQPWEGVVEVLGRLTHYRGALVDQSFADEPRVELHLGAHRVVPHVLDASDDHEIRRAHRDLSGAGGRRRQGAGAHPIDGEARHRRRQSGEQGNVTSQCEALVADLCGRGQDHVADPLGRGVRIATKQLANDLDGHVVGPGPPEGAAGPRLAERGPDAVDEHHLAQLAAHGPRISVD